ncbi:MAG: beta-propeller domain-containing protein [Labilithrix sp.]|nr:beta-propeller domain-containing protein [Labilithrix sp.]
MPRPNRPSLSLLPVLFAVAASAACADSSSESRSASSPGDGSRNAGAAAPGTSSDGASSGGSAERAMAEADVVQLVDGRLFAMSKSGTLSIIDASRPGRLAMLGQAYLPGEPFEMYLRGDLLVVMTNGAYSVTGQANEPARADRGETHGRAASPSPASSRSPDASAGVIVIDVKDPGLMQRVATFPVPGEIADSRIVGDILYVATYENASCYSCGKSPRTMVTSFDVSSPAAMQQVDHVAFENGAAYGASWGANGHKRSIIATSERLYVGGHADITPTYGDGPDEGVIDVLDITDPRGVLGRGAHIETRGAILSRWQMDEKDGVLRVVSQRGIGYAPNGVGSPEVQTFHIWNTRSLQAMGSTSLQLPRQEGLKAVRFDGARAYAITFNETDPLFVIDLANEAAPRQRGELHMPGWVFHLEPRGDRLLGLGLDRTDSRGHLNVSLFDVADMDDPKMLGRVPFGSTAYTTDSSIVSYELPEDQDRIQKAFRVFEDGLITVPFSAGQVFANGAGCEGQGGGIQLIDWRGDALTKQVTLAVAGNPRRALLNQGELLAVSDSNVTSFDIGRRDLALKTADLVIGSCEVRPIANNGGGVTGGQFVEGRDDDDYYRGHWRCSAGGAGAARGSLWAGLALGLAVAGGAVRRRRRHG